MNTHQSSRAFTLIELLVVVAIIAIIGVVAANGFARMNDGSESEAMKKVINNMIGTLDRSVLRHEITSYDAVFESGSVWFLSYLDGYKKSSPLDYSYRFDTGTGVVKSLSSGTGEWELHFATYDDVWKTTVLDMSGGVKSFVFPSNIEKRWYKVSASLDDTELNSLIIQYYNLRGTSDSGSEANLTAILWSNNVSYDSLVVRNILGKKTLIASGATLDTVEKATLFFEKNGKWIEMTIAP